jgi:hypothetical protein
MNTDREKRFDWPLCHDAEQFILERLDDFCGRNPFAKRLSDRMLTGAGTLLLDWLDHLIVPATEQRRLCELGFAEDPLGETDPDSLAFWHPDAMLPRVLVNADAPIGISPCSLAVRADSVSDFLAAHNLSVRVEGEPLSRFRRANVAEAGRAPFFVIERRGYRGYVVKPNAPGGVKALVKAHELWKNRLRHFTDDAEGIRSTHDVLEQVIKLIGRDLACHVVFWEERAYWQGRNRAAQVQKARQDRLGLGWANHDHHTFRSSRRHFVDLMQALEKLGFERRERYYAGAQAGWGAQILEQPVEGITAFCDVDLEPHETELDFSRYRLPDSARLGTIGLWVGLHGESLLDAGMHHLECRFDHELLREQLSALDIQTMKPFSDFPFLKQAFTEGERWPVRPERAGRLRQAGLIDKKQFEQFTTQGALGSHLENLQRKGGFKGFNQKSVSVIIQATDPRIQPANA